ncbi:hypothetical protein KHM83_00205 [Fusibacter paucivorans]|uniref:Uncharacterized protein n=1 Tax=Fusibacter paucivorans TaxID=76009 RepID=A0ABS5PJ91_9FIRM|nr:hypothetical protein [Fusibacter paucivorans]MBS7525088.1 hypothetical protein [Fusibacter paucivorans]
MKMKKTYIMLIVIILSALFLPVQPAEALTEASTEASMEESLEPSAEALSLKLKDAAVMNRLNQFIETESSNDNATILAGDKNIKASKFYANKKRHLYCHL